MAAKLDISKPLRLIGIQIYNDTLLSVRKALVPGWYPFIKCDNNPGQSRDIYPVVSKDGCPVDYYRIYEKDLPRISISAIAGKNGTGKSTLLDILYRILNNFAETTFLQTDMNESPEVKHAYGVSARLHFELDGVRKFIDTGDVGTTYFELIEGKPRQITITQLSESKRSELLNGFFYTISINYSIYSFNPRDYLSTFNSEGTLIGNNWIDNIFHKNDGYYLPLVLTPFRQNGAIDVNNENDLAEQRLNVLSLLFHSQNKEFLDDYVPSRLFYRFDFGYKERKQADLYDKPIHHYIRHCQDLIIAEIEYLWEKVLSDKYRIELNPADSNRDSVILYYLAYKTLKICRTYPVYREISKFDDLLNSAKVNPDKEFVRNDSARNNLLEVSPSIGKLWVVKHRDDILKTINAIIESKGNHVTLKIHQCLDFLKSNSYTEDDGVLDVDNDFINGKRFETFESVMLKLPPSFFISELRMRKKNERADGSEITFASMSSGERQLLYAMSYVFYHIKNIASIKENGKRIVGYHHINLIFDEAELYYHPEYQRQFIKRILDCLAMCHINRTNIRSINLLIVTHSPFILSDIPETNILFLTKDKSERSGAPQLTLGANIYDLLKGGFFLEYAMGDFVQTKLQDFINLYHKSDPTKQRDLFLAKRDEYAFTIAHLGEDYLRQSFQTMFEELSLKYNLQDEKQRILRELEKLEQEQNRLKQKLIENETSGIS